MKKCKKEYSPKYIQTTCSIDKYFDKTARNGHIMGVFVRLENTGLYVYILKVLPWTNYAW